MLITMVLVIRAESKQHKRQSLSLVEWIGPRNYGIIALQFNAVAYLLRYTNQSSKTDRKSMFGRPRTPAYACQCVVTILQIINHWTRAKMNKSSVSGWTRDRAFKFRALKNTLFLSFSHNHPLYKSQSRWDLLSEYTYAYFGSVKWRSLKYKRLRG